MGNYGLIILTFPFIFNFMSKYQNIMGPSNKAWSPFYIPHVHKTKERGKNPMGKSSLKHGQEIVFGNLVINHSSPHDQKSLVVI